MNNKTRRWHDPSREFQSQIYCDVPAHNNIAFWNEEMREPLIVLQAATTCVAVTELTRTEPSTITLKMDRPAFCMMVSASPGTSVRCGYEAGPTHSCVPGHILFLVPGQTIVGHSGTGSVRSIMCSFGTDYAEAVLGPLDDLSQEQLLFALNFKNSLITSILLRLTKEAMHPSPISEAIVDSFGHAILIECASWLLTENSTTDLRGKLNLRHFAIIEEYLNGLTGKSPSVADLAKACGFSERYFLKLFREQTNCSVAQYIKSFQMSKAKTYLLDTDLPLKEIAYRLGYSSPAYFSSAFRAATGSTPGQMRKER